MASALMELGRMDEAIPHSQAAVKIDLDNAGAFSKVPIVLTDEQTQAAIAHWQQRIEKSPRDVDARDNLGVVLFQSGAAREAVVQWQSSLEINPNDGNALNNLAWVLATHPDAALRSGATAVELAERAAHLLAGENPTVLRTLAAAYAENGEFPQAVETAERASKLATAQRNLSLAETLTQEISSYRANEPHREGSKQ